jgi:hypothetical protein
MKSPLNRTLLVFAAILILNNPAISQTNQNKNQSDKTHLPDSVFFNSLINQYTQSIDKADTILALKIWSPTSEISFINPLGTEYGWNGIKKIYKMFNEKFSARKLSFYNLKFTYYGDVSWVTFYWTFDAALKPDNTPVQTKGRETQIWRKINYEWRLVHVHYSGMPASAKEWGFNI